VLLASFVRVKNPHQRTVDIFVFQVKWRQSESEDFVLEFRGGGRQTEHATQPAYYYCQLLATPKLAKKMENSPHRQHLGRSEMNMGVWKSG
jgi:hypothetical protein